ncbi:macro domain-containing protein [Micromonospora chersina]|uniref:macro domain-containing protein n=1 Tax=Micromonospora chersina TaxID=47854 RepID=UPI0036CE7871
MVAIAGLLLVLGLAVHIWSTGSGGVGRRRSLLVPVLLCYTSAATILLFSLFPDSFVEGGMLGFTVGGGVAYVLVLWVAAARLLRAAEPYDERDRTIAEQAAVIANLRSDLDHARLRSRPTALTGLVRDEYRLQRSRRKITLASGDLSNLRNIDVWVNSENTGMEMSRYGERTISGFIRYQGARRDLGQVIDDLVYDELRSKTAGRIPVPAGTAVTTGAGALTESHGVRRIVHVAAVEGSAATGFRQVANVGRCVCNALEAADHIEDGAGNIRSVLVPLFGTGMGHADVESTAETIVGAALDYLISNRESRLQEIVILAGTDEQRVVCRAVLERRTDLRPATSGKVLRPAAQ